MTYIRIRPSRFVIGLFLVLLLLLAVQSLPAALSADGPLPGRAAPLNPAFLEYVRNRQLAAQGAAQAPGYGYVPPSVDLSHIGRLRSLNASTSGVVATGDTLPASFDWRASGNVTAVRNQNPCGTCWAFGNTAVMESRVSIQNGTAGPDYSEQSVVCCTDPSWTALAANRCNNGGNDYMAQDTFTKKGARLESCQPYNTATINSETCLSCTPVHQTTNFVWVADNDTGPADQEAIKTAIQAYGPVTVSFYYSADNLTAGYIYWYPGTSGQNHTVSIVGWDDSIAHPAGGGSGAWLTRNSWGPSWGDSGYFWLCYGKSNATDFGSLRAVKAYDPNEKLYYLDESGWVGNTGWEDTSAWVANMFTATATGNLTNVDFYTGGVSTQYNIFIYKSGDIQDLGTPATTENGTCGGAPGYYSIPLGTQVSLNSGQPFTIAVKMTTPGYNFPIPVEYFITGQREPVIQAGTYERYADTDEWVAPGWYNACLRARVTSNPAVPVVTSDAGATSVMANTAILRGSLTWDGGLPTSVTVYGGLSDNGMPLTPPGGWTLTGPAGETPVGAFSLGVTGLSPNTTYYYRCYASNTAGSSWSGLNSFTTQPSLGLWRNYWAGPGRDWFWFSSGGP